MFTRRFYFFDKDTLKNDQNQQSLSFLKDIKVTCGSSGRNLLWFGDAEGFMHSFDRSLQCSKFRAFEHSVRLCKQMKQQDLLITVGIEGEEKIKIWNTSKWGNENSPFCNRIVKTGGGEVGNSPVTCVEVMESLTYMFVGYSSGAIQMFKGDITRDRSSKLHILRKNGRPITNLGVISSDQGVKLFVSTDQTISCLHIDQKDKFIEINLDQFGCNIGCAVTVDSPKPALNHLPFITACKDAIYFYQSDSRGPCLGVEGNKFYLQTFKNNYLLVLRPTSAALGQASATNSRGGGGGINSMSTTGASSSLVGPTTTADSYNNILSGHLIDENCTFLPPRGSHQITIFDHVNKFIAGEFQLSDVKLILSEWGKLFILCGNDNKIVCLTEKETQAKLDLLFAKKSYNVAIDIAKSQKFDDEKMANLFRTYADHLYKSKEFDSAIQEYIKTIGKLEPSYVIQRFLETSQIHNLTAYLQALHKASNATKDHTTLLLNCYAKLREEESLNNFIQDADEMNFDVETAIRVLRQSGMQEQAQKLGAKFGRHDWFLRIVIEDRKQYVVALDYIKALPFDEKLKAIVKYGSVLMEYYPQETADVLQMLCDSSHGSGIDVSHIIQIFVSNRAGLMVFLEKYIENTLVENLVDGVVDTLLELYLYSLYVQQQQQSLSSNANPNHANNSEITMTATELEAKILRLLKDNQMPYNPLKQLMLCRQRNFIPGYLLLCERTNDYKLILKHHMEAGNLDEVIDTCKLHGEQQPTLWIDALEFFGGRRDSETYLHEVINVIDDKAILPPLSVIHRLAKEDSAAGCTLASVKDYLLRHLQRSQTALQDLEEKIMNYRKETEANQDVIWRLTNKATRFQMQKCSVCHQPLELPSVHFLCEHSFHLPCFENYAENEEECPRCLTNNIQIKAEIERWNANLELKKTESGGHGGRSLTDAWNIAYEGLDRAFPKKATSATNKQQQQSEIGAAPSSSSVGGNAMQSEVKQSGKGKESLLNSKAPVGYVGRVATSASATRSFSGTAKVEQVVASAGQTLSEATAAATNIASGLFSHVKESLNLNTGGGAVAAPAAARPLAPVAIAPTATVAPSVPIPSSVNVNKKRSVNPFEMPPSSSSVPPPPPPVGNPFGDPIEEVDGGGGGGNPFGEEITDYPDELNPFQ